MQAGGFFLVVLLFDGMQKLLFENQLVAQKPWIHKVHLGPQVHGAVFYRGTCKNQSALTFQFIDSCRNVGTRVFDRLRLIQDDIVEVKLAQLVNVHPHDAIGSEHYIVAPEFPWILVALGSRIHQYI